MKKVIDVTTTPIFDSDGNLIYIASFHRDITDKYHNQLLNKVKQEKLLQVEIECNQSLRNTINMKDEFLSLISHELKTPLTIINSAIQTMEIVCKDE